MSAPLHPPTPLPARLLRRGAGLALGLVAALVLLELALQAAALVGRPAARFAELARTPGERRILCVGDSFTYGIHLPPEESYPAALQALLEREPGQPWRVFNLGYPGQNSAQVRLGLAQNIALYEPEIVVALCGANNVWSPAERHLWEHPDSEPSPGLFESLVQQSRALSALSMLAERLRPRAALAASELERDADAIPGVGGAQRGGGVAGVELLERELGQRLPRSELRRTLEVDVARMRALAAEHEAALVVADYPVTVEATRRTVNVFLREIAAARGIPCAPLERELLPLAETLGEATLWLPDNHCTAAGNREIARLVLRTLMDAGLVEERPRWRNVEPLAELLEGRGLALLERRGDVLELALRSEPHAAWRLELAFFGAYHEGGRERAIALPLEKLPPAERTAWSGRLDADGTARTSVRLPRPSAVLPGDAVVRSWRVVPWFALPSAVPAEPAGERAGPAAGEDESVERWCALPGVELAPDPERE